MTYYRLKKNKDFQRAFSSGKKIFAKDLMLIYLSYNCPAKVGYSISKKHGNAVKRNRIKRLLRAAFHEAALPLKASENFKLTGLFVFLPKVSENYSFWTFKKQINFCLSKI